MMRQVQLEAGAHIERKLADAVQHQAKSGSRLMAAAIRGAKVGYLGHHCAMPQ